MIKRKDVLCRADSCYWNYKGKCLHGHIEVGNPRTCGNYVRGGEATDETKSDYYGDWPSD